MTAWDWKQFILNYVAKCLALFWMFSKMEFQRMLPSKFEASSLEFSTATGFTFQSNSTLAQNYSWLPQYLGEQNENYLVDENTVKYS